jgi:hypothetical protein
MVSLREIQRESKVLLVLDVPDENASDQEKAQYKMQHAKVSAMISELREKGVGEAKLKPYVDIARYGLRVEVVRLQESISKTHWQNCLANCKTKFRLSLCANVDETSALD